MVDNQQIMYNTFWLIITFKNQYNSIKMNKYTKKT